MDNLNQPGKIDLGELEIKAEESELVVKAGRKALYLKNGQAQIGDLSLLDACVEVWIYAENPVYPGIFFRKSVEQNFELAYPVPHASGLWDALQYDPIMNGSNTWQNFYGPAYQLKEDILYQQWFKLKVNFSGEKAAVSLDDRSPLVVDRLAFEPRSGKLGLWTYLPVWFAGLQVLPPEIIPEGLAVKAKKPAGVLDGWFTEDGQFLACETNGVLNLNRYFPASKKSVFLTRKFSLEAEASINFDPGFSDKLVLKLDEEEIYSAENHFKGFADRSQRGYSERGIGQVSAFCSPGEHVLEAEVSVSEPFGWGLIMSVEAEGLVWEDAPEGGRD